MDALETVSVRTEAKKKPSKVSAQRILDSAAIAPVQKRESVALGLDIRLQSDDVMGAGLEHDNWVLQMSLFLRSAECDESRSTSMERASSRSRALRSRLEAE